MRGADLDTRLMAAIERLARTRRATLQRLATQIDLSPLQAELLAIIGGHPPPLPQAASLARELDVSAPTVADAIAALTRKGLVTDRVDPTDRRRKTIFLTRDGAARSREIGRALGRLADPLADISQSERGEALQVLLTLIAAHFDSGIVTIDRSCLTCEHHRPDDGEGGYCELLRTPLTAASLQVNCADHAPTFR